MSRLKASPYIEWAKSRAGVRYNLADSSVRKCPPQLLAARSEDFAHSGDNLDGWPPLLAQIGERYRVDPQQVVFAHGTSMANHLVCATLLEPGDQVLIESPVYEPLHKLPAFFRAQIQYFERRAEDGYRIDPDRIERLLGADTRLLILSNLHNPTGTLTDTACLESLADLAESYDFHILVDEIYLEFLFPQGQGSAHGLSPRFITTSGLTKAYGLHGLRAGWILAEASLAEKIRRLNDLFTVVNSHPCERLTLRALERSDVILEEARKVTTINFTRVSDWIDAHQCLTWSPPPGGPIAWVRLAGRSVEEMMDRLEGEFETTVAPGLFFGQPDHFRIGFGGEPEMVQEGLRRISQVLS